MDRWRLSANPEPRLWSKYANLRCRYTGEYQTEFPKDGSIGVVNGWELGIGCGGLAGITQPCSRMKPYYVKVDGTKFYYSNNGTEYIDISITNGTTTKTKSLRVNINYTAAYGF